MLKAMRHEVQEAMAGYAVKRTPTVRRSDREDMLLACDLPSVASETDVQAFTAAMEAAGWTVERVVMWLLLDKTVPMPVPDSSVRAEGQAACCISLLERHPSAVNDERAIRAVVKAGEKGMHELQRVCLRLHAEWAEKLARGELLPGKVLPYLQAAVKEATDK